jgi:uncharacterized protein YdhG (YjbR/CyaY superfamily)
MRAFIKAAAPDAVETMSYAIPTASGIEAFKEELAPYKSAKGSVQFPLGRPLPADLISRIVASRVAENMAKPSRRRGRDVEPAKSLPS